MEIEELKKGQVFWLVDNGRMPKIDKYTYVTDVNDTYHIVMKNDSEPVRVYHKRLAEWVKEPILSYKHAVELLLAEYKECVAIYEKWLVEENIKEKYEKGNLDHRNSPADRGSSDKSSEG